ncbi:hypothetical protein SKAU_G00130190 [Synaphobranchus kaupii]|uniref:Uncharacterized protein n=1 Tax=Synaphobranchus kaupii TaxID=118154 RepID=A0A9Q1J396_SYNKA|nr:hypothetical protein SKAU_G00130190 [Synaphobranchus kaupii]
MWNMVGEKGHPSIFHLRQRGHDRAPERDVSNVLAPRKRVSPDPRDRKLQSLWAFELGLWAEVAERQRDGFGFTCDCADQHSESLSRHCSERQSGGPTEKPRIQ